MVSKVFVWGFCFFAFFCLAIIATSIDDQLTTHTSTDPSLDHFPPRIDDENVPIVVSWANIPDVSDFDIVVLYYFTPSPSQSTTVPIPNCPEKHFIGWYNITQIDSTKSGQGQVSFPIFLPRQNAYFYLEYLRYYDQWWKQAATLIVSSALIPLGQTATTTGFHLSYTHDPTVLRLMYTTTELSSRKQVVQISTQPFISSTDKTNFSSLFNVKHDLLTSQLYDDIGHKNHPLEPFQQPNQQGMQVEYANIAEENKPRVFQFPSAPQLDDIFELSTQAYLAAVSSRLTSTKYNNSLVEIVAVDVGAYTQGDMCNAPANQTEWFIPPGSFREVLLPLQLAATRYYYRVVQDDLLIVSPTFTILSAPSFTTTTLDDKKVPSTENSTAAAAVTAAGKPGLTNLFLWGDSGVGLPFFTAIDQQPAASRMYLNIATIIAQQQQSMQYSEHFWPNNLPVGQSQPSILHIGDISYSRGHTFLWDYYFQQIQPLAASFPYMIGLGNHEVDYTNMPWHPTWADFGNDSGGECIIAMKRFHMPRDFVPTPYSQGRAVPSSSSQTTLGTKSSLHSSDIEQRNIAYSYNVGTVHIIVMSTEHDFTKGSQQYNFIIADLQAVNRQLYPWVILAGHRPMYCSSQGCDICPDIPTTKYMDVYIRDIYQPILLQYRVTFGLWGHVHQYERTCQMSSTYTCAKTVSVLTSFASEQQQQQQQQQQHVSVQPQKKRQFDVVRRDSLGREIQYSVYPFHLVVGSGGNEFNDEWEYYSPHVPSLYRHAGLHQQPEHITFRTMSPGFIHLVANMTHMHVRFYSQHLAINDDFWLEQPPAHWTLL